MQDRNCVSIYDICQRKERGKNTYGNKCRTSWFIQKYNTILSFYTVSCYSHGVSQTSGCIAMMFWDQKLLVCLQRSIDPCDCGHSWTGLMPSFAKRRHMRVNTLFAHDVCVGSWNNNVVTRWRRTVRERTPADVAALGSTTNLLLGVSVFRSWDRNRTGTLI